MAITGNLETMELAELLQWLSQGRKTGTLVVDDGRTEKRIYFRDGKIISSLSSDPHENLGHLLVSHGLISEEQLRTAMDQQEENHALLGANLLALGAIEEEVLLEMLRLKAEETLFGMFAWKKGDFRFLDDELPDFAQVAISLDVTGLVLEAYRRLDEWERVREVVSGPLAVPVAVAPLLDDPELEPGQRAILELVDDDRSVEDLCLQTHSSEFYVSHLIFQKAGEGKLKVVRPRVVAPPSSPSRPPLDLSSRALMERAASLMAEERFQSALRHLRAARSLEPDSPRVQEALREAERTIRERIARDGVVTHHVPRLAGELAEITSLDFSPKEAFILSRIDGSYTIGSIVKISPMPELDALLVFWRLARADHIRFA